MDDEDYELVRPKPSDPPPLQRLWKSPPEPEDVEDVPSPKKKRTSDEAEVAAPAAPARKKKKKIEEEIIDDGTGAIKLEATPVLDTYETRQRVRLVLGLIAGAIGVVVLMVLLRAFKGSGTEDIRDTEPPDSRATVDARAASEREARSLVDMAKDADRNGKTKTAVEQLNKVTKTYAGTAAAREALHALDRHKNDQSLFGEDAPTQLSGPKPPPPGIGTAPGPVVPKPELASNASPGNAGPPKGAAPTSNPAPPPITRPLPPFHRPNFQFPIDSSGWPTRIVNERDGAEMVLVPAATFVMGRDDEDTEAPAHEVSVSTFYIDLHEVTVGQYLRFLKDSGRALDVAKLAPGGKVVADDMPIVNISSKDAKAYCTWMKRRLPTEAEWELAARGAEGRISYWNEELPRKDPEKGERPMEPVMSLSSDVSPYGAMDMAANAWEWTSEFYDSRYYRQFRNRVLDPTGPKEPPSRPALETVKGGSSKGILTWRRGLKLETKASYVGFRGAIRADGSAIGPVAPPPANVGPALKGGVQPF